MIQNTGRGRGQDSRSGSSRGRDNRFGSSRLGSSSKKYKRDDYANYTQPKSEQNLGLVYQEEQYQPVDVRTNLNLDPINIPEERRLGPDENLPEDEARLYLGSPSRAKVVTPWDPLVVVLGYCRRGKQIYYKWSNHGKVEWVTSAKAKQEHPRSVCHFFELHITTKPQTDSNPFD